MCVCVCVDGGDVWGHLLGVFECGGCDQVGCEGCCKGWGLDGWVRGLVGVVVGMFGWCGGVFEWG